MRCKYATIAFFESATKLTFFHLAIHCVFRLGQQTFVNFSILQLDCYHVPFSFVQ